MAVRLFVGNLPYDVTEAELRAHFAAIGPLAYLAAMDRDTGTPRGFAFVEFSARPTPRTRCAASTLNDHQLEAGGFKSFRRT